jgi:hypothetical protein
MVPRRLCFFGYRERVLRLFALCALALTSAACGGSYNSKTPASKGVQELIAVLNSDDPHRAYELLSDEAKRAVSYKEFEQQWRLTAAERAWQTTALKDSLRGAPNVGERAIVGFPDGKSVPLERDGKLWRVEVPLVTHAQTPRPRDAIRAFADALEQRDVSAALSMLTKHRRDGLARQIEGFLRGLGDHVDDAIDEYDGDRAELRWDQGGIRYRVLLRREDDEWRIDDISIRMTPKDDSDLEPADE